MMLTLHGRTFFLDVGIHQGSFGGHDVLIGRDVLARLTTDGFRLAVS